MVVGWWSGWLVGDEEEDLVAAVLAACAFAHEFAAGFIFYC